jgi:MerR family glutamine synthetase transcriptional repressor
MSSAMKLTGLTARQIRHYETNGLIVPARSKGNHRLFTMNDLEQLLTIKVLMEKGFTMKRIGEILDKDGNHPADEVLNYKALNRTLPNRGDLSRFF